MHLKDFNCRPQSPADYHPLSKQLIKQLREEDSDVVIFGAQGLGGVILNALVSNNISVTCFCDNLPPDSKWLHGLLCLNPSDAAVKYPDAVYILSALEPSTCQAMRDQITSLIFDANTCFWDVIYYQYIISRRGVDKDLFAEALWSFWGYGQIEKLTITSLSLRITSRCTLKCRDCSFLVPFQPERSDFPLEEITMSLRYFCKMVDGILDLTIHGGETFLYSDFVSLINEIVCLPKIINIVIVTNGTIIPTGEVLRLCADNAIRIRVSEYGEHSSKVDELREKCKEYGVSVSDFQRIRKWFDIGTTKHNRDDNQNRIIAENCPFNDGKNKRILGLYKGGIYLCARYDGLSACGYISGEYYSDLRFDLRDNSKKEEFWKFLEGTSLYKLCDFCNWPMDEIPPGVQLEEE